MYFAIGWPTSMKMEQTDSKLVYIRCNLERSLFMVLTEDSISLWYYKPSVQIFRYCRSMKSVYEHGINETAIWKPDSSQLAVSTSRGYLLFYDVHLDNTNKLYVQKELRRSSGRTENISTESGVPSLVIVETNILEISDFIYCVVCLRNDEMLVATHNGRLLRIRWEADVLNDLCVNVSAIPFSNDLQHSHVFTMNKDDVSVIAMQYSPLLTGFAVVLSNGKAAFITAETLKFQPKQMIGIWAPNIKNACCMAINHRYMLVAYGQTDGEGSVFYFDEEIGSLALSHQLIVSSKDFPDISRVCGSVATMKWSPDGCALAVTWTRGGFSIWSVFGALLLNSMGVESSSSLSEDLTRNPLFIISSMEWSVEGYHLWMISSKPKKLSNDLPRLMIHEFVKAAISVNPCAKNHNHLFLQGADKLYLNPEQKKSSNVSEKKEFNFLFGNKQWQILPVPATYLASNWPIRYAAVNLDGTCVAVAGKNGLAHYTLNSRKWKLFGNETQEQDMMVTGGLTWWNDYICMGCHNFLKDRYEIRFYPKHLRLDDKHATSELIPSQIMLVDTFNDVLIMLCADSHIVTMKLDLSDDVLKISRLQEISIVQYIPHPATIVSISLTSLRSEKAQTCVPQANEDGSESIMLNVAGRVMMLQRDLNKDTANKPTYPRPLPFCAPVVVAYNVESMWSCVKSGDSALSPTQLSEALWLSCGAAGIKIWLPLHPLQEGGNKGFMSKRIMLPFHVDIYPIALLFEAGIILGASSECVCNRAMRDLEQDWPYLQLERTSQVYLHHVLRKLLRRNLGVHALAIAGVCTEMPHFHHILELLVHEVLEEEATSKYPLPDPLLPRVIAFVQEFPAFLQTVVHCARKTEVALWKYLFDTVGNPRDLFIECMKKGQLETAASYLIILQSLEPVNVAQEHASSLLLASLKAGEWRLTDDIVRFLRSIEYNECDTPLLSFDQKRKPSQSGASRKITPPTSPPPMNADGTSRFIYPLQRVKSQQSRSTDEMETSQRSKRSDSKTTFCIESILNGHASSLITNYKIRDFALFAANLDGYKLVQWLRNERTNACKVQEFDVALKCLHADFHWPYPILSLSILQSYSNSNLANHMNPTRTPDLFSIITKSQFSPRDSPTSTLPGSSLFDVHSNSTAEIQLEKQDTWSEAASSTGGCSVSRDTNAMPTSPSMAALQQQQPTPPPPQQQQQQQQQLSSEEDSTYSSPTTSTDAFSMSTLDQLTQELANRGPQQSETELRYLFQVFLEAGCLEWSLLLSVVLRDCAAVTLVFTATLALTQVTRSTDNDAILWRIQEGVDKLWAWVDSNCIGYRPFLASIDSQVLGLKKCIANLDIKSTTSTTGGATSSVIAGGHRQQKKSTSSSSMVGGTTTTTGSATSGDIGILADVSGSDYTSDNDGQGQNVDNKHTKSNQRQYECSIS